MFKEYINYIKDNPKNYWFKEKLFGWGWVPARWQGWVVVLFFLVFIISSGLSLDGAAEPTSAEINWFFAKIILASAALIFICYKTGEKPHWRWGLPKSKTK